ncbi:MAG: ribulose-phosphate 3-epimerase [Candidatus Saganbacteria bacterium]|nr:ribulose-phosphate 3-epimerase [Candidatus Saganbacteria bacterium]
MIKIAPSILSADFSRLGEEIRAVEAAGADLIHIDVMDGHFVPNITIGPAIVRAARRVTALPLDVHLMIEDPAKYIRSFLDAGSDIISFHIETAKDPDKVIREIKNSGKGAAIALNPDTDIKKIEPYLEKIKMVLVMSVFPGFEKQVFIPSVLPNIKKLRDIISAKKLDVDIEVDGGINPITSKDVISAGANILVAGSAVFYGDDYKKAIRSIRNA